MTNSTLASLLNFDEQPFRPDHVDYMKVFKILRGYFKENILIGGSYTYSKELDLEWNGKDIDVFILIPRMESWALQNILNLVFDDVHVFDKDRNNPDFMKNKANYYKIAGQWKRVIAYKNSMMYDLIFVDAKPGDVYIDTGSTISQLYYKIGYKDTLTLYDSTPLHYITKIKKCYLYKDKCTEAYASKIKDLCKQLNLRITNG